MSEQVEPVKQKIQDVSFEEKWPFFPKLIGIVFLVTCIWMFFTGIYVAIFQTFPFPLQGVNLGTKEQYLAQAARQYDEQKQSFGLLVAVFSVAFIGMPMWFLFKPARRHLSRHDEVEK
jgi:hypothetical protein